MYYIWKRNFYQGTLLCVCSIESYVWVDNVVLMQRYIANAFQFDKNISLLAIKPVIFLSNLLIDNAGLLLYIYTYTYVCIYILPYHKRTQIVVSSSNLYDTRFHRWSFNSSYIRNIENITMLHYQAKCLYEIFSTSRVKSMKGNSIGDCIFPSFEKFALMTNNRGER